MSWLVLVLAVGCLAAPAVASPRPFAPPLSHRTPAGLGDGGRARPQRRIQFFNWAGYAAAARAPFRRVRGTWAVPAATCKPQRSAITFWVGLGAFLDSGQALEQTGTDFECGPRGRLKADAWYELLPAPPVVLSLEVAAGDRIAAGVSVRGERVAIHLQNLTSGASFSKTLPMSLPDTSSAEWIVETPLACKPHKVSCRLLPAPTYGPVTFTSAQAATAGGPMSAIDAPPFSHAATELLDHAGIRAHFPNFPTVHGSNARALPGALSEDGESFTVTQAPLHPG